MIKNIYKYSVVLFILLATIFTARFVPNIFHFLEANPEHELLKIFFVIASLFALSFIVFYISHTTTLPSFVIAILFGLAAKPALQPITEHHELLNALVGFGATLILFSGGLETPFVNFKKLVGKIFSLSFPGLLLTAFLLSNAIYYLSHQMNTPVTILVAVLLGALLASTDPAAIIPILKRLRFKNRFTKDIIISESAVTDVTGTLLTIIFLSIAISQATYPSITDWYKNIFSAHSGFILLKQTFFGVLFGLLGFIFLELLQRFKKGHEREFEADSAFFLFIPVIIFTVALALGGSGYLAAFIAGLLFSITEHLHDTERFFNHIIDGFFKPTIFILLGALVDLPELISYAGIGTLAALTFMFIIRPLTVFLTLGPWSFFGPDRLGWRDLLFISFVRETGAIPAVLIVTISSLNLAGMDGLVAIGMWVILLTLIIEPVLTPAVAKKLLVAEPIADTKNLEVGKNPIIVLGTRGLSFINRLPFVVEWAKKHGMSRIMILLCLEQKYDIELEKQIAEKADAIFKSINNKLLADGSTALEFYFQSRTGFLQENIQSIAEKDSAVSIIFVGRKMLDYRLNNIKQLSVPLYFLP